MGWDSVWNIRRGSLDRRAVLGLGLAGAAMAGHASAATVDIDAPDIARHIYRKMRYRTDSGLVFAWVKGGHMAEVGPNLTPLHGTNLGAIQRVTQRADGGFDVRSMEVYFSTDPDTGRRLTTYLNPLTKAEVVVPSYRPEASTVTYSKDNIPSTRGFPGMSAELTHYPVERSVIGDTLYLRDRSRGRYVSPNVPVRIVNEISTLSAPLAEVLDPNTTSVNARLDSNDVADWPSWMKMGDQPGIMALYAVGGKVSRFEDMPADWLEMVHEVYPDIARDPVAALDRA
jgi:hypothetical protein